MVIGIVQTDDERGYITVTPERREVSFPAPT